MKKILIFLLGLIVSLPLDAQKKDILSDTLSSIPVSMPEKEAVYVSDSKNDNVRMTHSVTNKIIGKNTDEEYISKKLLEKEQLPVNNTYTLTLEEQQIIDKKKLDLDKYISSQSLSKESVTLSKESITLSDDQQAVIQSSTSGTGNTRQNPIVAGSFSTTFTYTNTQNTNDFTHDYTRPSGEIYKTNDVFYKFTLTKAMTVNIRHCGSQLSDTYLYLLNSSGGYIDKNDDYSGGCSSIRHAYYTISLSAGTYYVVSEGYSQNGYITTTIEGTMITGDVLGVPIVAGSFSTNFSYSNSQNTNNFTHKYTRTQFDPATKDVFYKFTITNYMSVIMKHCGSSLDDTYLYLLDASGNLILPRDDYSDKEGYCSSNILHSYLKQNLAPGTYYVVSEGYNKNGVIKTQISGTVLPTGDAQINPFNAGTFSDNFQYSNTQNTANFHDEYHYPPKSNKTNDVFHRFTLSKKMTVTMTHCGSALGDTYMCLLDEKGDLILPNDDYWTTGDDRCSNSYHSVIKRELDAGTYYIVSEGYSQNGSITLNIKGFLNEFNYPQSYDANINISGGSATATIPIEIPAGVNGVQPNVGLIYNNRAGFGLAGYGWTVSGLSTITVTGKNLYHDNEITSPTSGGPYVLDGQRMIADGSNYTLENNRSVSIRPSGTNYIVYYPDGSKATYSAYISKYIWRITKFETYTGNYVTYTYSGINIDKIEYGGNSGKGSSHFVSVKFTYESNPDINVSFIGKNILKYDQRIKVIEICVNSSVFRTYKLNYNNGYYKQLSRVDIKANYETMQPVTISYGYNTNAAYNLKETTLSGHYYRATNHRDAYIYSGKICDWENSNQIVVLQRKDNYNSDDKIYVYEGIDAFTTSNVGTSISMNVGANFKQLFVANVDGTPEDEIVKISQTGVQFTVDVYTLSLSTGIVKKVTRSSSGVNAQTRFLLGDFKGKGRNILLHVQPGSSYIYLRDLTEASAIGVSIKGFDYKDGDILLSMDYDGDGKTDFAHVNSAGLKIYTVSATGTSWTQIASSTYFNRDKLATISEGRGNVTVVSTSMLLVGDINGDGRSDFLITPHSSRESNGEYLLQPKYNRQWVIFFSDGTGGLIGGTFADDRYNSLGHVNIDGGTFLHDMNGDGKSDLVTMYKPNEAYIYYSIGDGFLNSNYKMIPLTGDGLITTINRWSSNNNNFLAHVRNSKIQCVNFLRDEQKEAFLTKMGNTQVNYDRIDLSGKNGKYFYNHGSGATLPYRNLKYEPLYVVTNYKTSSGNIVISNYDYTYTNAVAHLHGLGFCGFEKIEIYDKLRGQTVTETYEPYRFGLPQKTESPTQISENTWSVTTTSTYPKSSKITLTKQKVTDKLTGNVVEATLQYNSYGMPTKTTITKGSMTETVSNTYEGNVSGTNWTILPKTETVVRTYDGTTVNTVTSVTYNSKYLPEKKTVKTGTNKDKTVSEENFVYDAFGNITESSVKRYGSADVLTNKYTYSANGRFVLAATNEMGQTTTYQYNDLLGLPTASKDFKNNTTSYAYNSFGKLTKTTFPDGVVGEESLGGVFSTNTVTSPKLTITETGNPKQEILYDVFMREKSRGIQGFDGSMIYSTTEYNSKGEVYRVSEPGSTSRFTTYTYDSYGRPTKTVTPSGKTTAYSYSGKTSTVSEHGFSKTTTLNNDGFTDKISDAAGDIKYSYRADGQPKSITAPDGSVTSFEYDDYGRQTSITDPSAGTVSYAYDKNGYANKQTDAAGKISETVYNKYGQPTSSTVKNGTTTELSTSYVYNSDYLLKSVSAGGTNISYTYDNLLRTKTRAETVGGTGITETYDYTSGKPTKVTYSGLSGTQPPVTEYVYTNNYLRSIKSGSTVIKTINSKNKFGQTTQYTLGNGVVESRVIDVNGNPVQSKAVKGSTAIQEFNYSVDPLRGVLTSRKDNTRNILESFTYDSQRRLTNYTRNGQAAASVVYSPMGNITSKTDAGTLEYNVPGKPYAIGTQTGNLGSVPERVQDITYTGFQRPSTIEENGYKATFTYGPDYVRSKMEIRNSSALQSTRYYLGGCYEKDVPASGSTTERLYIGGNAYNAPAVYIRTGSGAWTLHYIHRDHLGSITAITNTAGTKIAEYSFDPWGRQRNPVNQQAYEPDAAPSLLLGRGYTGHEHLPMFGLVNMNARLYDPVLGRFLSPDPYVQAPEFSQSFNRYSYCLNNPLMYVDESGEFWWMIPAIIGLNWIQGAAANNWNFNPTNWDWNKTTFNVGFSTAQNGSFYAGLTWGNNNAMVGLGMNSNGNPLIVGGELGNTVSADLAKYAAQFSKRIPQHTPSNAAILPWEPSWIDKWSRSDNFFLNFSYEIIDGLALTLQAPFSGPTSLHLTGEPAVGDDMINGYVTTVTTVLPLTKIVTGAKIAVTSVQAVTKGSAKLLTQFSSSTIDDAVVYAMKYKVNHIFGKAVHNLDPLVTKFGGQENTFRAVLNAANGKLPASGVFNNVSVNVGGYNVIIRGSVVNGVPKIGTMFIP